MGQLYTYMFRPLEYTSRVPVEGKSSVCVICMKYKIIVLIIIIISVGQIILSYMGPFKCYTTQMGVGGVCQTFRKKRYEDVSVQRY